VCQLPYPRLDGSTHLQLDPLELIESSACSSPGPSFHLLRFHGVLALRSRLPSEVVPRSSPTLGPGVAVGAGDPPHAIVRCGNTLMGGLDEAGVRG